MSDLSANTVREFTTITHGGVGGTSPTFGGGGGAAAYFGGANATITVRSNLLGGSGWVGYSSTDGSGGGGDGLIVMDGKVNVTATGQLVGGDATYSMGGRPGSGGAALYRTKARSRMPALSSAARAATTTAQPLRHRPRRQWRRRGRAAQWPHGQ